MAVMTSTAPPRRRRDKAATEQALIDAALELLHRDGVLVGLNMQEVADHAGVSRGLIHHHVGSRRALLRAAVARELEASRPAWTRRPPPDPDEPGRKLLRQTVRNRNYARMLALLLLDDDETLEPIPHLGERLMDNHREQSEGFVNDADHEAMIVLWDATTLGYSLMREAAARQLGLTCATLDTRVGELMHRRRATPP
jgi:AcrR family transcriptional regulator